MTGMFITACAREPATIYHIGAEAFRQRPTRW
jgi:hypothetical protein